jgi:hypothetical protein
MQLSRKHYNTNAINAYRSILVYYVTTIKQILHFYSFIMRKLLQKQIYTELCCRKHYTIDLVVTLSAVIDK